MSQLQFRILTPEDHTIIELISEWYCHEWKIPKERTIQKLTSFHQDDIQFQIILTLNNTPIATGGLHTHVGLLDIHPKLKIHKYWLGAVYTIPSERGKGYGALICQHIEETAKVSGVNEMYLFTDTAERLYKRLGWTLLESLAYKEREVVVMKKEL